MRLTQERLGGSDPWKVLVCCILLNRTQGQQSEPVLQELFNRWPDASKLVAADDSLEQLIAPLGLVGRAKHLRQLSKALQTTDPQTRAEVESLPGCGEYAADAWDMLINGRHNFWPRDSKLGPRMLELRLALRVVKDFNQNIYLHICSGSDGATLVGIRDQARDLVRVPHEQFKKEFKSVVYPVERLVTKWIECDSNHYIPLTERGRRIIMTVLVISGGNVTKFADLESATAAAPQGATVARMDETELGGLTLTQLTELYNEIVPEAKRVKTFKDKPTAVARVIKTGEAIKNPEPKGESKGEGSRTRMLETDIITVMVSENPKRPGDKPYEWFKLYRDGMTVKDAMDAGIPRPYIIWDRNHNFISVSTPKEAANVNQN